MRANHEGSNLSTDFSMFAKLSTQPIANITYSFHTYNVFSSSIDKKQVEKMKKFSDQHQAPIWNSEFGTNTAGWVRGTVNLYETPGNMVSVWVYWSWKRVGEPDNTRWAGLMEIPHTPNQDKTRLWIGGLFGLAPKPNRQEVLQGMCEFLKLSASHNLIVNKEMAKALLVNVQRANEKPDSTTSVKAMCPSN